MFLAAYDLPKSLRVLLISPLLLTRVVPAWVTKEVKAAFAMAAVAEPAVTDIPIKYKVGCKRYSTLKKSLAGACMDCTANGSY